MILSALDTMYRPRITNMISGVTLQEWERYENSFEPEAMLKSVGWTPDQVRSAAEALLGAAHHIDPLRDWFGLVQLCLPAQWEKLRGDALVAMDHRMAAEILLLYYDDLVAKRVASPLPEIPPYAWHPLCERLRPDQAHLDRILMKYGISPHPSLVIFLEGQTEMFMFPRVMDFLGIPRDPSFIQLHNAFGTGAQISRYALYVAPPTFGEAQDDYVSFTRPPTRFLVVFDRENQFKEAVTAEHERQKWIGEIAVAINEQYALQISRDDLEWLVQVVTWESGSFEFANFDNAEISQGLYDACLSLGFTPTRRLQEEEIETVRQSDRQDIERLWEGTDFCRPARRKLSKLVFARAAWPILEHKIKSALERGAIETIPVAKVVFDAADLAREVRRHNVIARRASMEKGTA